ncbi:MAG: anaerobic dehydrogenase [Bacteroidetes bacterium]|nr:anaerobic dehydrogenase [Bacteroidota bacterium]
MAKIKRDIESTQLYFRCPGCDHLHALNDSQTDLRGEKRPVWEFNGDFEKPTINPSYLSWSYRKNPVTEKWDIETDRCHSFIKNGMIQYLSDCHHKLAGQTIELPEIK